MPRTLIALFLTLVIAFGSVAHAQQGERYRLEQEMDRHAAATRWKGVERTYEKMYELQTPLATRSHYIAALSAEANGDITLSWTRLERAIRHDNAVALEPEEPGQDSWKATLPAELDLQDESSKAAMAAYNQLTSRYGRVSINVSKGRVPALLRLGAKPFSSPERGAISTAQKGVASNGKFVGLLPVGKYMVDGERFEVTAGELTIVRVEPF